LDAPFVIGNASLNIGVSIGIKIFPDHIQNIEEVIKSADTAMYQAKTQGKNRFVFFDAKIEQRVQELEVLEEELKGVMERQELSFFYQPKVDIRTEEITGAELLVRWEHPERGVLYPSTFLEALQNISMMPQLSEQALETACRFLVDNQARFSGTLAINIAAYELRTDYFVKKTKEIINRYSIDPSHIEFEILENDLIEDFDAVISKMNELKAFGVQFSIDDFGIGYSSINYLSSLPVNKLKIDRNFTIKLHEEQTKEMVKVIIKFAKVFGLKTVIEGIDDPTQLAFAQEEGADLYQGYLFSEAVKEEAFLSMLRKQASEG
jgi:predicted signal transduction protein with EAL and GGDEF domain